MRPCSQNCGHGASNTPTSTRLMGLVTFSPCFPRQWAHATEPLSESVCVEVRGRVWALMLGARRWEHPTEDGPPVQSVWLRQKETQRTCSAKREPRVA